jgi:pimeloyl-ACP methyl ester carboxylesterase
MTYTQHVPPATLPDDLRHEFATINGIRMHYVTAGAGPETVVLLHGFPESWYSWRHQIAALAPQYRVVVPDQRGFSETEGRPPYDVTTLQHDILGLLAHIGEERVHLVGHDWGGGLAWLLATYHPKAVRSLTVCNAPHPAVFRQALRRPGQLLKSWYWLFFQLPWLPERTLALKDYHILARTLIHECQRGTFTRDDIRTYLASWRRQGLGGGINWYRALFRDRRAMPASMPVIDVPTLLVWGEADFALGRELPDGTEKHVRDLRVVRLRGISHWVQQDAPHEVNEALLEHLARVDGAR